MNPADHYHSHFPPSSKDCNALFNLNNPCQNHTLSASRSHFLCHDKHSSSGAGSASSGNLHSSGINNNININTNAGSAHAHAHATMGGQSPVFFAPSSLVVSSHHKPSQDFHEAIISANNKQLNSRPGPPQLVDFKEVIRRGSEAASGTASEQVRMAKRPHIGFASGEQNYDPGPGSGRTTGDEMSMDYADQIDGGEYMDPLEGGMRKGSRRLGYDQVKALEKAFAVENRLEPERKVRLASQLGLQPRQVAVWFQNRRARWKTKQMERDYSLLKNKFEALKADRDKLLQEKDHLQAELARLKGHPLPMDSMPGKKKHSEGEQDSPTLASCLLVDDAAANQHSKSGKQAAKSTQRDDDQLEEEVEEDEELGEDGNQNLLQNESLSSTEDSDINNDGAIVSLGSKSFQEDADYYTQQWRLPQAPITQLSHKPLSIKNEEWPEQGENMSSFNVHLDTNWYNWGC